MNVFSNKIKLAICTISSIFCLVNAQEEKGKQQKSKDTIATESIVVVKTYNPTINDAFKIRPLPTLDTLSTQQKLVSKYKINSVPVASTFVPQKIKSVAVKREPLPKMYNNYASLAVGNLGNVRAEFFNRLEVNRDDEVTVFLQHNSSQGNIKDVKLDDFYYDTGLQLSYMKKAKYSQWKSDLEVQHQVYNWYGLPQNITITEINNIQPKHTFIDANFGTQVSFEDGILNTAKLHFRHFRDDYDSAENNLILSPQFNFNIEDQEVNVKATLDYLGGSFAKNSFTQTDLNYQILNFGVSPFIGLVLNDIDVQIGFSGYVSADFESKKNKFFVYPNLKASYEFLDYGVSVFGGVTGGLLQNTYHNAASQNQFVAPQLVITPTNNIFKAFVGAKGSVNQLGYQAELFYNKNKNQALWVPNAIGSTITPRDAFTYGNSFVYVYDNVSTLGLTGTLGYDITDTFDIALQTTFSSYSAKNQKEAWNLPSIEANLTGNYQLAPDWNLGTSLFFVGERNTLNQQTLETLSLDSFFDANLRVDYTINKQWKAFVMGNNLIGQNYEQWQNFPVQGIQFLIGVKYQFNYK